MYVSARVDYAMRALMVLATAAEDDPRRLVKGETIAAEQDIPPKFLEGILRQCRQAGLVVSRRGVDGGYRLSRAADRITVADVVRALDGPLAAVRGEPPEDAEYTGSAEHLREVWIATRAALRNVLEKVTLADIVSGSLPRGVARLLDAPGAWERR